MHASRCSRCGNGKMLCEHKRRRSNCMDCLRCPGTSSEANVYLRPSSEVCRHKIPKKFCLECGGSHVCITCKLTSTRLKQTECSPCRRFRDGDAPMKQKEGALKVYLDAAIKTGVIPQYTSHDRAVALGLDPIIFGSTRPDWVWILSDRWIVLECDEDQHSSAAYSCERRRELQICNVAGSLPVFFIRFNPDTFKTGSKSSRVKLVTDTIANRHSTVVAEIKNAVVSLNPKGLVFKKLFFNCSCVAGDGKGHPCNFVHTSCYLDHEEFLMGFQ